MDLGAVVTSALTLAGVVLGSQLTARTQRVLLKDAQALELASRKQSACVDLLATHRVMRRALQTEDIAVSLVTLNDGTGRTIPRAEGLREQWEAYEQANAAVHLLIDSDEVQDAAVKMITSVWDIMRARATHPPAAVPDDVIRVARDAEKYFVTVCRQHLRT